MPGTTDEPTLFPLPPLPHSDDDQPGITLASTGRENPNQGTLPIIEIADHNNSKRDGANVAPCPVCHILVGNGTPGCTPDNIRCNSRSDPETDIIDPFNRKAG